MATACCKAEGNLENQQKWFVIFGDGFLFVNSLGEKSAEERDTKLRKLQKAALKPNALVTATEIEEVIRRLAEAQSAPA